MESFFASLKKEHVHQARFRTREEAKAAVFDSIEIFYNRQRLTGIFSKVSLKSIRRRSNSGSAMPSLSPATAGNPCRRRD